MCVKVCEESDSLKRIASDKNNSQEMTHLQAENIALQRSLQSEVVFR